MLAKLVVESVPLDNGKWMSRGGIRQWAKNRRREYPNMWRRQGGSSHQQSDGLDKESSNDLLQVYRRERYRSMVGVCIVFAARTEP